MQREDTGPLTPHSPCFAGRGRVVRHVAASFTRPSRFSWRLAFLRCLFLVLGQSGGAAASLRNRSALPANGR